MRAGASKRHTHTHLACPSSWFVIAYPTMAFLTGFPLLPPSPSLSAVTHEALSQDKNHAHNGGKISHTLPKIMDRKTGLLYDEHIPTYIKV